LQTLPSPICLPPALPLKILRPESSLPQLVATSSEAFPPVAQDSQPPEQAALCAAAAQGNHRLHQRNSGQTPPGSAPLLAGALAIALGLIGIHLAHFF